MGEHRMFAKTIIDSDAFLDMPLTTQALYFHLGMRADDEGFVNSPRKISRMIGASEDDLKILVAKKFIIPFESGIIVIKHWKINNVIRSDRKKDTAYHKELSLLTVKENGAYTLNFSECQPLDNQMTTKCQPNVNHLSTTCQPNDRISKDKISKDKLREDKLSKDKVREDTQEGKKNDYQLIADMYNETCVSFPKLTILSDARKKALKARLNKYSVADFQTMFNKAESSDFLKGGNARNWQANFDWMINDANMAKILDGNYDNKSGQAKAVKSYRDMSPTERLAQELDDSYEMMRQWAEEG